MAAKYLRLAYVCEFLLALVAVFTAWPEVGGQAALDLMHWGWKLGFGLASSAAIVAYTAAVVTQESVWTMRSARWLTAIGVLVLAMGVVTYYYTLEEDTVDTEESNTVSNRQSFAPAYFQPS